MIIAAVILGTFLIASFVCLGGTIKEGASLNSSKNKTIKAIRAYYKKDAFPPSEILLKYYEDRKEKILEYHHAFGALFSSQEEMASMPDTLKFKEELVDVQSQIKKEAKGEYLVIKDSSFGFEKYETEIPSPRDIPDLMLELHVVKELASLMMQSRVAALEEVNIFKPQDKTLPGEKNPFIRVYSVQVIIEADFESFVKFMDYCGKSDFVFALRDLHVYQADEGKKTVKADMSFNVVVFLSPFTGGG